MSTLTAIVPYRPTSQHRADIWAWVRLWWAEFFRLDQMVIADSGLGPFNRGRARNNAARSARGDVLLIIDADTIVDPAGLAYAVGLVSEGHVPWAIPYGLGRYYNLSERATARRLQFPPDELAPIAEPWDPEDWEFKIDSWAGCLVVRTEDFWRAGGYPEFETWGYEDDCFRTALDVMVGPHVRTNGFALHLWHPAAEIDRFGNADIEANRETFRRYKRARSRESMEKVIAEHGGLGPAREADDG